MSAHLSVDLSAGYEALRAQAVGDLPAESPRGLAIVVHQGLPAWIRAWVAPPPASPPPVLTGESGGVPRGSAPRSCGCSPRWLSGAEGRPSSDELRHSPQDQRHAPVTPGISVCSPVHTPPGAGEHRVDQTAVRAARAGGGTRVEAGAGDGYRLRPGPVRCRRRSGRLPALGGRCRHGRGRRGARSRGQPAGPQLLGLAPSSRDLRSCRDPDPGRGRRL